MANLEESINFDEGVYQIETDDVVIGGPEGVANKSAKNLANRTAWLKGEVDKLTTAADTKKQRMLGVPFWHLGETPPEHALQFSPIQLNRVQYKELWDSLNAPERNIKWVTEADKTANKLFGCWSLGDSNTTFGVPDPRGDFLRVWDNGRGADINRFLGSLQNPTRIRELLDLYSGTTNAFAIGASEIDGDRSNYVGGSKTATELLDTTFYRASTSSYPGVGDNTGFAVRPRNTAWMLCFYYE